ncbi:MAG: YHYH protein [Candidatus Kapaibacteriota bacterium]
MNRLFAVVAVLISLHTIVFSHTGGHHGGGLRTWSFVNGQRPVKASFRSSRPDTVVLEDAHHSLLLVALTDLSAKDAAYARNRISAIERRTIAVDTSSMTMVSTDPATIDATFAAFKPHVSTRWDDTWFYVENDGMPTTMPAMVGITAWQQQVPIPQYYTGTNAWQIPLLPIPAANPIALDTALHTGAVAIAVNGLPIFNPENNRGEFSQDIGELDSYGGHCGRADDYHYHIAPIHLNAVVGYRQPIAWALDGYPVYGMKEPDETAVQPLDQNLGHEWNGSYHYHAIDVKPYLIARMRGQVTIQNDQVIPQPRTKGVRPFLQALNGAEITEFHECDTNHYALKYEVNGEPRWVNYRWSSSGVYTYIFIDGNGDRRTETYQRK